MLCRWTIIQKRLEIRAVCVRPGRLGDLFSFQKYINLFKQAMKKIVHRSNFHVSVKVFCIYFCYFCTDYQNCLGQINIVLSARRQKCGRPPSPTLDTGSSSTHFPLSKLTCVEGTENRSSSLLVHCTELGCTKAITIQICLLHELFSVSSPVWMWW